MNYTLYNNWNINYIRKDIKFMLNIGGGEKEKSFWWSNPAQLGKMIAVNRMSLFFNYITLKYSIINIYKYKSSMSYFVICFWSRKKIKKIKKILISAKYLMCLHIVQIRKYCFSFPQAQFEDPNWFLKNECKIDHLYDGPGKTGEAGWWWKRMGGLSNAVLILSCEFPSMLGCLRLLATLNCGGHK
jgi:hypothetical protein